MNTAWFKARKKEVKVNDLALAAAIGRDRTTVTKIINGEIRFDLAFVNGFAKVLQVAPEEILRHVGVGVADQETVSVPAAPPPLTIEDIAAEHGFTFLEELDLALGMGATYLDGQPEVLGLVPFKLEWLRGVHEGSFGHLKVVRGKGDSMEPAIFDGDIVVVDTGKTRIDDQDALWALAYGDLGMIRRVRQRPNGSWVLMAEKSSVRDEIVADGEVSVIGKVVWSARRY